MTTEKPKTANDAQKAALQQQIKALDDTIARITKQMQDTIDRITKQRDEAKAKLAALG